MKILPTQRFAIKIKGDVVWCLNIKPRRSAFDNIRVIFVRFESCAFVGLQSFPVGNGVVEIFAFRRMQTAFDIKELFLLLKVFLPILLPYLHLKIFVEQNQPQFHIL